jgi:DNA ligase (NAD+)
MITLDSLDLQNTSPEKLGEILMDAKKNYYTTGKTIMDDHTYDTLEEILHQKNPHHRFFSKIGNANFNTGFEKKKHNLPMGSQNKVNKLEELTHYFELKKIPNNTEFSIQPKCDGISLSIEYKNGQLINAVTRGNGQIGDIITQNVVKMKNFINKIPNNISASIRCEIVMLEKDFQQLNKKINEKYSNSRNATSGISQRLDSQYSDYCSLYAVDVQSDTNNFKTEKEKIEFLKKIKFTPVENFVSNNFNQIESIFQKYLKTRQDYPFEIDGLVIKINDLQLQHQLGFKNNRPKGQVAYKFPARSNQSRIKNVNWQVGPMGTITPVAEIDPIEISGANITFTSLANYDLIKEKNINLNDIVEVQRRGDVIPHIEKVITKSTKGHIKAPTHCPSCKNKLITDNKFLKCPNIKNCPDQVLGSLKLFCDVLDIKGISQKTIAKLYKEKLIKLPGDFYKLQVSDFENIFGLGHRSGTNIVKEIQNKKNLTLKQILNASIIPNFSSQRIIQVVTAGFDSSDKIINTTIKQLESLPGIQITLAKKIYQGIQNRKDFIASILNQVTLKDDKGSQKLKDLTFAITGTLNQPRKDIENKIASLGGKLSTLVTKNTDYLITNQQKSNSSKFTNAQKFKTKIISESDFSTLAE